MHYEEHQFIRPRNHHARELRSDPQFRMKVVSPKKQYNRKKMPKIRWVEEE